MTPEVRFFALAMTFPTLKSHLQRRDGTMDVISFLRELARGDGPTAPGRGAQLAASFMLSVWGSELFDLAAAWNAWDTQHRAAWKAWAVEPWWL